VDGGSDPHLDGHLDGEWGQWATIAAKFARKAASEDRDDLRHSIILAMALQRERNRRNGDRPFSEGAMVRVASHTVADYWRERKRNGKLLSLDAPLLKEEGTSANDSDFGDTLVDDQAIDLDKWMDDRTWLLGFPRRLVEIAHKKVNGIALTNADHQYLHKWRRREMGQLSFE
jgi:hypothetical protein